MKGNEAQSVTRYTDLYRDLFAKKYFTMQYNFVQFLAEHLADVSRVFDSDLQSVIVLALIGQMELQARIRSNYSDDGVMPPGALVGAAPRINATSISEVSGIPRETVRRKLESLAGRGWIARDDKGLWHIKMDERNISPVRRELLEIDRRAMERVSRFLGIMHALAVEPEVNAGGKE